MTISDDHLRRVLVEVQRRGGIGPVPISEAIEHARRYVGALDGVTAHPASAVDLGSGGGLPALVIAVDRPMWQFLLVERRAKRADLLRYAVRALGLLDRVDVTDDDVHDVIRRGHRASFDVVTARSFAPLPITLQIASALLTDNGWLAVSEPPSGTVHLPDLTALGLVDEQVVDGIHRFRKAPAS